jgi:tryptophan synthase alpha chain
VVARTREVTDKPVCVGLGVSHGAQAAGVAAFADGVIVGSAFVKAVDGAESDGMDAAARAVEVLARDLSRGVRREL